MLLELIHNMFLNHPIPILINLKKNRKEGEKARIEENKFILLGFFWAFGVNFPIIFH